MINKKKEEKIKLEDMERLGFSHFNKERLIKDGLISLLEIYKTIKNLKLQYKKQIKMFESLQYFENEADFKKFCKYYNIKPTLKNICVSYRVDYLSYCRKWGRYNPIHYIQYNKRYVYNDKFFTVVLEAEYIGNDARQLKKPIYINSKYYNPEKKYLKYKNKIVWRL